MLRQSQVATFSSLGKLGKDERCSFLIIRSLSVKSTFHVALIKNQTIPSAFFSQVFHEKNT